MNQAVTGDMQRLNAFVDAAFAFAVTLLVVSFDSLPRTQAELITALKHAPSFLVSFLMVARLWREHANWCLLYPKADGAAVGYSLLLVAVVLIWIYPLRLLHDSFFAWMSRGWLPSEFVINGWPALRFLFSCYGLLFAAVYAVVVLMHWHAWRHRETLALTRIECIDVQASMRIYLAMATVGLASAASAQLLSFESHAWLAPIPGVIYGAIGLFVWIFLSQAAKARADLTSSNTIPSAQP